MSHDKQAGELFVVASPIGNLSDLSERAVETLREADLVVAEDTRRTGRLLAQRDLRRPLLSCHRFNEASRIEELVARLQQGERLALVSDGGTPAVSDPGYRLVAAAHAAGIRVTPIPGPSAVITALSAAGFPADRFHFAGFLPTKAGARRRQLERLARVPETLVLFEAPHRLLDCLADLAETHGERELTLCRELTKLHEEIRRGRAAALRELLAERGEVLGEIVLVVAPAEKGASPAGSPCPIEDLAERYAEALAAEDDDPKRALRRLSRDSGHPRAEIKEWLAADGLL